MIGNCLVMGVDWRALTWGDYLLTLTAWNVAQAQDGAGGGCGDFTRLKKAMAAHTVH